jgi:hypothetical protein
MKSTMIVTTEIHLIIDTFGNTTHDKSLSAGLKLN